MTTISKDFIVKNGIVVGDNADVAGSVTAASFSGDGSALTGTATSFTANNVTTNANLTGVITSSGNSTSIASQTGTGSKFVVDDSPTLITPNLGTPSTLVGTNITGTASGFTAGTVTTNANLTGGVTSIGNAATVITNANLTGDVTSVGNAATVITNANLTGVITSSGNATSIASQTGTGTKFVVDTAPLLNAPTYSTNAAFTAGTAAQGQGPITTDIVVVTTAATNPSGVTLPVPTVGRRIIIVSRGANQINVYPSSGCFIDSLAANSSILVGNTTVNYVIEFIAYSTTKWQSSNYYAVNPQAITSAITAIKGGTGQTVYTVGDILYASTSSLLSKLAAGTATYVLTSNGAGVAPSWATIGNAATVTTNANLTGVITSVGNATSIASQTGTGSKFVVDDSPTLITPNLGTPSTLVGTNITGTASGLTSGTVTTNANLTGGVTSVGNAATVITNANLTGVITSSGNATSIASQTGTGTTFVVDDSPTLITPNLGTPSTLVGTNITGTASSFTASNVTTNANLTGDITSVGNATKVAGQSGNTGKYLKTDGTSTSWANASSTLASLTDVILDTPLVNQLLGYNGATWTNTNAPSAGAGAGVVFYNATPVISASGTQNNTTVATLATIPVVTTEQTATGTASNNTIIFSAFISGPLNRTVIDSGVWDFTNWIGVDSATGSNLLTRQVYTAIPFVTGTVTMTGTGTTRTATASAGTPFATSVIDASATNTTASYLQTPAGLYQITARTSDTEVTIGNVPTTYTNESAVAGTVLKKLFGITTQEITSITPAYGLYEVTTTAASYPVTVATGIAILGFFTSTTNTITIPYNGTSHNTHISTPLVNVHSDLAGLQGGTSTQYYHLTSAEYTGTGTGAFVRSSGAVLTTPDLDTPSALIGTNITGTGASFTAGNVTTNANLTGGVTSVGNAATVITNANLTGGVTSVGNAATVVTNANLTGGVTSVGNAATVVTNANLTGVITSSGNATSIASQTGTGSKFVVDDSPTLITPNLGTPSTLVGTNITGTASGLTAGTVTTNANLTGGVTSVGNAATVVTNANLTGVITSSGNATSIASQTGTGTKFVVDDSPTLITPNLGTPSTLVGTNITGTASSFTASNVTTNANLTGDITSVGNATKVAGQSGNTGKYLKTDGTSTSWAAVNADPVGTAVAMAIALG